MICDSLRSATTDWLQERHDALRTAFDWLRAMRGDEPPGITELRGPDFYVNVHDYPTQPAGDCRWESHRRTVDLQYCIAGGELIDWMPPGHLKAMGDYAESKDAEHWHDAGLATTRLRMIPGTYAIFLPNELHRPKVSDGQNAEVRKLVVKIPAIRLGL